MKSTSETPKPGPGGESKCDLAIQKDWSTNLTTQTAGWHDMKVTTCFAHHLDHWETAKISGKAACMLCSLNTTTVLPGNCRMLQTTSLEISPIIQTKLFVMQLLSIDFYQSLTLFINT